jgi:hypothetical protein
MLRRTFGLGFLGSAAITLSAQRQSEAWRKMDRLQFEGLPPGEWIAFSSAEVNELVRDHMSDEGPPGVRQPRVELSGNAATGRAYIDFLKVRESMTGAVPGFLSEFLFGGEKAVAVEAEIRTGRGECSIHPRRVEIQGIAIGGRPLEWLIENFLIPLYPGAKIGRPFEMPYELERVEITPSGVRGKIFG